MIELHRKAKTAIKSTKATPKYYNLIQAYDAIIYKEKYKFNVYIAKQNRNGPYDYKSTVVRMQQ